MHLNMYSFQRESVVCIKNFKVDFNSKCFNHFVYFLNFIVRAPDARWHSYIG